MELLLFFFFPLPPLRMVCRRHTGTHAKNAGPEKKMPGLPLGNATTHTKRFFRLVTFLRRHIRRRERKKKEDKRWSVSLCLCDLSVIEPFSFIFFFRWDDDYLFGANRNSSLPGNTRLFPRANETHTHTQNLQLRQTGKKRKKPTHTHTRVCTRFPHQKGCKTFNLSSKNLLLFWNKRQVSPLFLIIFVRSLPSDSR